MRLFFGLLILGSLFLMAALWQDRITQQLRGERRLKHGVPMPEEIRRGERWSRLVLGRPSGAEDLPQPVDLTGDDPVDEEQEFPWAPPSYAPDYRYEVQPSEVLGTICQRHYDDSVALSRIVDAVADYNGLRSPDAIRQGQLLLLPDLGVLFPER